MPDQPATVIVNGVEVSPTKKVSLEKMGMKGPVGKIIEAALAKQAQEKKP